MRWSRTLTTLAVGAALLALASSSAGAGKKLRSHSEAIFRRALAITGSPSEQNVPYVLRATLRFPRPEGDVQAGFTYYWDSPEKWREECHLPKEDRVRVANHDTLWESPARDVISMRLAGFRAALEYYEQIREMSLGEPVDSRSTGIGEQPVDCVTVQAGQRGNCELCVEPDRGLPRILACFDITVALSGYVRLEDRLFPRSVIVLEGGKPVVEADMDQLVLGRDHDVSLFTRPADTEEWPWCADPEPLKLIETPRGMPPVPKRNEPGDAVVTVHAIIGVNGQVERPKFLSSHEPEREQAILRYLEEYRYQPARCGQTEIPREHYYVFDITQPSLADQKRMMRDALRNFPYGP